MEDGRCVGLYARDAATGEYIKCNAAKGVILSTGCLLYTSNIEKGCCQTPSDIAYAMPPPSMREASQLTVMSGSLREGAGVAKP